MTNQNNKTKDEIPYQPLVNYTPTELIDFTNNYYIKCNNRRTVRTFSDKTIPKEAIENLILTASTAPSGAHKQPWTFVAVQDAIMKKKIRLAAEEEEYKSYTQRMPQEWLNDLKKLKTNWEKPFLEIAPWLIIVFKQSNSIENGNKTNNYYVQESVGLACGFLINAIHHAGLVSVTYTPSPMNFLSKLLNRPQNEKPFLVLPVGYPLENTMVPNLKRKELADIAVFI